MKLLLKISFIALSIILFIQCKDDINEIEETQTFLCCSSEDPFASVNVDVFNLEDTIPYGEFATEDDFYIPNTFSPNSDGDNDTFIISFRPSLEDSVSLEHISVIIYDLDDNIVYQNENININTNNSWFDGKNQNGEELHFGSYKYKIVIENEQTFLKYGYVCLVRDYSEVGDFDISKCLFPDGTRNVDSVTCDCL